MQHLPPEQLDRIWSKLTVAYGHLFKAQWDGIPMGAVREDWAEELAGFTEKPWAIDYALQHRPDRTPLTAAMFRRLCSQAPDPAKPPEAIVPADPRRVAAVVSKVSGRDTRHPKAWAWDLRDRELRGDMLSRIQRMTWRQALGYEADAPIHKIADSLRA